MSGFRNFETAARFDDELQKDMLDYAAEKAASTAEEPLPESGLVRIAEGRTAFAGSEGLKAAADADTGNQIKEHEVRKRLVALVKQKKANVDTFLNDSGEGPR
jgi:hypothetical protein